MKFGELVRAKRLELGWPQSQLADAAMIPQQSYVSHIESGFRRPKIDIALRVAKALGAEQEIMNAWKAESDRNERDFEIALKYSEHKAEAYLSAQDGLSADSIYGFIKLLEVENQALKREVETLRRGAEEAADMVELYKLQDAENSELRRKLAEYKEMESEYTMLLGIMEKRRSTYQQDEPKPAFRMDRNGNLERL